MKHIYLINEGSRAATYGIGSYIRELTECIKDMPDTSLTIVQLKSDEKEFTIVERENHRILHVPSLSFSDSASSAYYRNAWYLLKPLITASPSDTLVFHLNYYRAYYMVKYMRAGYPGCRILYTIHCQEWCTVLNGNYSAYKQIVSNRIPELTGRFSQVRDWYEKELHIFQAADHIICLSQFTRDLLTDTYKIPSQKTSVIPNGLQFSEPPTQPVGRSTIKKELFILEDEKIILYVGRLDEAKGIRILLEAFRKVHAVYPMTRLILIGDGDYHACLKDAEGIWNKITFTGRISQKELFRFYQIADVGVMPSFSEQCSYAAIEMMAFGLPIVAASSTGLGEMVRSYAKGIVVNTIEYEEKVVIPVDEVYTSILAIIQEDKATESSIPGIVQQVPRPSQSQLGNLCSLLWLNQSSGRKQ